MDTFRALAPPEGMKYTKLFTAPVDDQEARFQRLEAAVQSTRDDFDTVVPSLVRLVAIEKDMKDLIGQLQSLTQEEPQQQQQEPSPPPAASAQLDKPMAMNEKPLSIATNATGAADVQDVRIGDHPGKTRIVIDLSAKITYKAALQDGNRSLAIQLPDVAWKAKTSWNANGGDLVSGYAYQSGTLLIKFISPSKILAQSIISGENDKGYRIVIDVAGQSAL